MNEACYTLTDARGRPYPSPSKGAWGGHRRDRVYGLLTCGAAIRALAAGGYRANRVFFADEDTARAAGYRPCAACVPVAYAAWRAAQRASDPGQRWTRSHPSGRSAA